MATLTTNLIGPPAIAQSYGVTELVLSDDFDSTDTIDLNATFVDGFNWYFPGWTSLTQRGATQTGIAPSDSSWFSVSNSILTISQNQNYPTNGKQMSTQGWNGTGWVGSVPMLSGARPFYLETYCRTLNTPDQANRPAFWVIDRVFFDHAIADDGSTERFGEVDIFEGQTDDTWDMTIHDWSGGYNTTTIKNSAATGTLSHDWHKWGCLFVPIAHSGGNKGFVRWFLDDVQARADMTWVSGGNHHILESGNFPILLAGFVTQNFEVDYVRAWQKPA